MILSKRTRRIDVAQDEVVLFAADPSRGGLTVLNGGTTTLVMAFAPGDAAKDGRDGSAHRVFLNPGVAFDTWSACLPGSIWQGAVYARRPDGVGPALIEERPT